ncbi:MAG TPA: hypothetical protein VGM99_07245 [Candidatus Cybelea sp.]
MTRVVAAALLGASAGLRSQTPAAVLALAQRRGARSVLASVFALGEYAGDLSPRAPDRTSPLPLLGRIFLGARAGLAMTSSTGRVPCAIAGAMGALAGAYGGLAVRRAAARRFGAVPAALVEDGAAIVLAFAAVSISRR